MPCRQASQAGQQPELSQHRAHRDAHLSAGRAGAAGEFAFQFVQRAGDAAAGVQEGLPLGQQRQAVRAALDQAHCAGLLDSRQGAPDLAHGHLALARHRRQRAEFGHAGKQLHGVEVEVSGG